MDTLLHRFGSKIKGTIEGSGLKHEKINLPIIPFIL